MDERHAWSRRDLLRSLGAVVVAGSTPLLVVGCGDDEFACTNLSGLTTAERQARTVLAYVDRSPQPDKRCDNCRFFKSAGPEKCGGCQLIKGPVHPKGYCKSWVTKEGAAPGAPAP